MKNSTVGIWTSGRNRVSICKMRGEGGKFASCVIISVPQPITYTVFLPRLEKAVFPIFYCLYVSDTAGNVLCKFYYVTAVFAGNYCKRYTRKGSPIKSILI